VLTNDKTIVSVYDTIRSSPSMAPFYIPSTYTGSSPLPEANASYYGICFSSAVNNYCLWIIISGTTGTMYRKIYINGVAGDWLS